MSGSGIKPQDYVYLYGEESQIVSLLVVLNVRQKAKSTPLDSFNQKLREIRKDSTPVTGIESRFVANADGYEDMLKEETVGLISLAEYSLKRERIESELASEGVIARKRRRMAVPDESTSTQKIPPKQVRLSFQTDEDDEDVEAEKEDDILLSKLDSNESNSSNTAFSKKSKFSRGSLKNPSVDTSFLPDRERDTALERERIEQRKAWIEQQEQLKASLLEVEFHFFDGITHPKTVTVKQAQPVKDVLELARKSFGEIKKISSDKLMMVKDNWILPPYLTFYQLRETFGGPNKSEPLGSWSAAENSEHKVPPARVMERFFYEKNKHIYPYKFYREFDEVMQRQLSEELVTKYRVDSK